MSAQPYWFRPSPTVVHTAAVLLTVAIFVLDLNRPAAEAIGMFYVLVIVLGIWTPWTPFPIVFGLIAAALNITDLLVEPNFVFVNRPLMMLSYVVAAGLVFGFKRVERARKAAEDRLAAQASLARVGQLAAMMAHEVKNPLAGVKGAIQVLMSRRPEHDAELPVMRDMISRLDALNDLIGDVLVFARPKLPQISKVEVRPLLLEAAEMLRKDPLGTAISFDIADANASIPADAEMLGAAIFNLLLNAAQAMNGRGRVAMSVRRTGETTTIEVRDEGPGIPPELAERVFDPFFTTKARGSGLGLPIARRTAELHGGRLEALTPPQGGGALMLLTLPTRPQ